MKVKEILKKCLYAVFGLAFIAVLSQSLFVCLVAGIGPLTEVEEKTYLIKALIMAITLPVLLFGAITWIFYLLDKLQEKEEEIINLTDQLSIYKAMFGRQNGAKAYGAAGFAGIGSDAQWLPKIVAALGEKRKLSDKDKDDLLKYIEEL